MTEIAQQPLDNLLPADCCEDVRPYTQALLTFARNDPATFAEYVMRDEGSGMQISLADIHREWHQLVSDNERTLIFSSVETGKTFMLSICRVLWELGNNPNLRIAIISNTHEQASKIVRTIGKYIEQSIELHNVFPKLKQGEIWSTTQLIVQRNTVSKDPSVQACGIHGNITGARIDRLILDDVLDYENTRTEGLRQDLYDWYHATLAGRLTEQAKVWIIGTAYHPDDLLHRFAKHAVWHARSFPIINPDTGESSWPERWSMKRIEKRREEIGPLEFARQMMCQARDDGESRFQRQWIELCMARGRRAGGSAFIPRIDTVPQGFKVYTGVDLAISRKKSSDYSCLFTIGIHPDGSREVLCIESGKWSGPEIVQRIVFTHQRYHSIVYVESNAAQEFIVQFTRQAHSIPVRSFTTLGQNKAHPEFGVESIAAEMAGGKWIIPCDLDGRLHPDVSAWITEMLYYDPMGHTGDRLMASWIAREGGRTANRKVGFGSLNLMRR